MTCPCGLGVPLAECCGRLHDGHARAATAEQLMRSRFSAFAVGDAAYLLATWHKSTRPKRVAIDPADEWTHLEIVGRTAGGPFHTEGTVEFRAHYEANGKPGVVHENSRFVREDGNWSYVGEA
ncbi:YchJ family protein [Actinokineospora sp. HUAS TT18]|uniref:YchJ family protein n=1 Tax=Actinokineospora sp. HUAS TT18 TaxID=3447451 RepID=UPI003F51B3AC